MKSGPGGGAGRRGAKPRARPSANPSPQSEGARAVAPLIVFHGDADDTVIAANGQAVIDAALAGMADAVAETVADPAPSGSRRVQRTVWRAADAPHDAPSLAERWLVHGAPHAWSGGAAAGSYTDPQGPDASRAMLRFFREHPRRS